MTSLVHPTLPSKQVELTKRCQKTVKQSKMIKTVKDDQGSPKMLKVVVGVIIFFHFKFSDYRVLYSFQKETQENRLL